MFSKPKVEISQTLDDSEILFKVDNGLGKLSARYVKDKNDNLRLAYFLDKVPLIITNSEYCPTCSEMVRLVEGRERVDSKILSILDNINRIETIEDALKKLKPILYLLDTDYYVLKEIDLIPTDGEGNFFWNLDSNSKNYNASADYYLPDYGPISGTPKFMLPSQGSNCYNSERVEYYRELIKKGKKLYGIAIEYRAFMALLIDGHHKATAAYLEGKPLSCITINRTYLYRDYRNLEEGIYYLDKDISFKDLVNGDKIKTYFANKTNKTNSKYKKIILDDRFTKNIDVPKMDFPSYEFIALSYLAEDTSDEKIEELLKFSGEDYVEELKYIFYYLRIYNEERAKKLAFRILDLNEFQSIWGECINFLSKYRGIDIEDLFVDFLVQYDNYSCIRYDGIKKIIDDYFKVV